MIREGDSGLILVSDRVKEGKMEPVCPDHSGLVSVLLVEDVVIDDWVILVASVGVPQVTESSELRINQAFRAALISWKVSVICSLTVW